VIRFDFVGTLNSAVRSMRIAGPKLRLVSATESLADSMNREAEKAVRSSVVIVSLVVAVIALLLAILDSNLGILLIAISATLDSVRDVFESV
jgi:hypothetical protein